MTATSTLVGIGMMPLNAWIYSRSWADHKTVIPVKSIMIGLASMLIPVAIGMVILAKLPKVAVWITRVCKLRHYVCIKKTRLYNFDPLPLKPHFYIVRGLVKLGFTGYSLFFLILLKDIDCGYSLEPPRRAEAVLTSTRNLCFEQELEQYRNFFYPYLVVKFSIYLNRRVFVMTFFEYMSRNIRKHTF